MREQRVEDERWWKDREVEEERTFREERKVREASGGGLNYNHGTLTNPMNSGG